jgi:tetratricopeptide (TPR) repeat protein
LATLVGFAGVGDRACGADELERHLAAQRRQIDDSTRPMPQRERLALDAAATLDRAAQAETRDDRRRARWAEATALLDSFNERNPGHPEASAFALQAAVYQWARARSWMGQAEFQPTDDHARAGAVEALDSAVARLRPIATTLEASSDALAQNVRYRLARALADRASLELVGSETRRAAESEALAKLGKATTEPTLRGFAELLRADLLARLGKFDEARTAFQNAARAKPAPSAMEQIETEVAILTGRRQFDEAIKALAPAKTNDPAATMLALRVRLAQRESSPEGGERHKAEAEAFRLAESLRQAKAPEARLALVELARAMETPDAEQGPDAWDDLAEGQLVLGQPERAARLCLLGSDQAQALGQADRARTLRYKAAGILFEAAKYARVGPILMPLIDDAQAGPLRPKASLLRILALGRAWSAGESGASREEYVRALVSHLRLFPIDPTAGEARWLLGRLKLDAGDRDEAIALWSAIPPGNGRRLDAQLAIAGIHHQAVDAGRLAGDRVELAHQMDIARIHLDDAFKETRDPVQRMEIELEQAVLDLTPGAGDPDEALKLCERLAQDAPRADLRERGNLLRIVALAEKGRYADAERRLRESAPGGSARDLLPAARLLDRFASAADSDLVRRRIGPLMGLAVGGLLARPSALKPAEAMEARLCQARGLLFGGDPDAARKAVESWPTTSDPVPTELLHDLADLYTQVGASSLAVDAYRLLMKRSRPGSIPWFDARLGLAQSYAQAGQPAAARQLIDATAILHPDLGGSALRERFERLRQRLGQE